MGVLETVVLRSYAYMVFQLIHTTWWKLWNSRTTSYSVPINWPRRTDGLRWLEFTECPYTIAYPLSNIAYHCL